MDGTGSGPTATFRTARLVATPLAPTDTVLLERLWGDERVARTLGGSRTPEQVHRVVSDGLDHWRRHGFGRWVLRAGDEAVGTVKLAAWDGRGRAEVELGYALLPECWGRGYATEACAGALAHAATTIGLTEVVAFTLPGNHRSSSVMRRLGFSGDERVLIGGREHVLRRRRLASLPPLG